MNDLTITLINKIRAMQPRPNHVGEVVPQGFVQFPYIFVAKGSEQWSDDIYHPPSLDQVGYDIEVIGLDINEIRSMTSKLKTWLMLTKLHELRFENSWGQQQTVQGIVVNDHNDDYVSRYQDSDEKIHIGSLDVQIITGEIL